VIGDVTHCEVVSVPTCPLNCWPSVAEIEAPVASALTTAMTSIPREAIRAMRNVAPPARTDRFNPPERQLIG
jgi:hypothetical protein